MSVAVDPITASVIGRRLKSITGEMGLTLLRTTRSPILNEARDFVTGLYDENGDMLEQTEYIPVLAFALEPVCKRIFEFFGPDIHPGDVILHNDVFSGGNQNNDVAAFRPVFAEGTLVAWAACKGHQADIGGAVAGGYNPDAREVWQEALRIPPLKVYDRGVRREDIWRMIFANIRYSIVEDDIKAQIGGTALGERGVVELIERYGLESFRAHKAFLFDSTEMQVAAEIEAIPDGRYRGESTVFYDGVSDGSEMRIALEVAVDGGTVTFDFTGSSAQTPGFVNAPFAATASAVMLSFLMLIDPEVPHNAGIQRRVKIFNPEGSFLNAAFPAVTTFGNSIAGPTSDAIMRAFAQAVPGMVSAGWNRFLGFAGHRHRSAPRQGLCRYPVSRAQGRLGRDLDGRRLRPYRADQLRRRDPRPGLRDVRDPEPASAGTPRVPDRFGGPGSLAGRAGHRDRLQDRRRRGDGGRLR